MKDINHMMYTQIICLKNKIYFLSIIYIFPDTKSILIYFYFLSDPWYSELHAMYPTSATCPRFVPKTMSKSIRLFSKFMLPRGRKTILQTAKKIDIGSDSRRGTSKYIKPLFLTPTAFLPCKKFVIKPVRNVPYNCLKLSLSLV